MNLFGLGRLLTQIVFLVLAIGSIGSAQIPQEVGATFSKNAILVLDIPNLENSLKRAKAHWYDLYFGEAAEAGYSKPLEVFGLKYERRRIDQDQELVVKTKGQHWLEFFSKSIEGTPSPIAQRISDLLAAGGAKNTSDIANSIAELFPGRFVYGLEPNGKYCAAVLAFEFDRKRFDWGHEFRALSLNSGGKSVDLEDVEAFDVHEYGVSFFELESTIFMVVAKENRDMLLRKLFARIRKPVATLADSRYFKRVVASLAKEKMPQDIFCFVRFKSLFSRLPVNASGVTFGEAGIKFQYDDVFSANAFGAVFGFGGDCEYRYTATYPLLQPIQSKLDAYLSRYADLEFEKVRLLAGGPSNYVFSKTAEHGLQNHNSELNARKQFSIVDDYRENKSLRSTVHFRNPSRVEPDYTNEECRIEVCRFSGRKFMDVRDDADLLLAPLLYGYQVESSPSFELRGESFIQDASQLLDSPEFKNSFDKLARFGFEQLPSYLRNQELLGDGKFRSLKSKTSNGFVFSQYGDGRVLLHVSSRDGVSCVFNGTPYKGDELFDVCSTIFDIPPTQLILSDYFPGGVRGCIKLIGVERALTGQGICREILMPIVAIARAARLSTRRQNELPLISLMRAVFTSAIPRDFKQQASLISSRKQPFTLPQELKSVTLMTVSGSNNALTYYGVVK